MSHTSRKISNIFTKYHDQLSRFLALKYNLGSEAEDVVQEAFHNMLRMNDKTSIDNPKAYLYKAASNIALNHLRRQGYKEDYLTSLSDQSEGGVEMEIEVIASMDIKTVNNIIAKLSEKDRTTFLMNRIHGKSYTAISEELGITISAVEKRMMKVLSKLRNAINR